MRSATSPKRQVETLDVLKLDTYPPNTERGAAGFWKRLSTPGSLELASGGIPGAPTPVGSLKIPYDANRRSNTLSTLRKSSDCFVEAPGAMQVQDLVTGQRRVLVRLVALVELRAHVNQGAPDRPIRQDVVVGPGLDAVLGNTGQVIPRLDLDIAVLVLEGVRRRTDGEGGFESRIHIAVVEIRRSLAPGVSQPRLCALAPGRADVLEEAGAQRRGNGVDVVIEIRAETSYVPGQRTIQAAGEMTRPRRPASNVCAMTCRKLGGSPARFAGKRHGNSGSEHWIPLAVGARLVVA